MFTPGSQLPQTGAEQIGNVLLKTLEANQRAYEQQKAREAIAMALGGNAAAMEETLRPWQDPQLIANIIPGGAIGGVVKRGSPIAAMAAREAAQVGSKTAPLTESLGSSIKNLFSKNPEVLDVIGQQIAEKQTGLQQFGKQSVALEKLAAAKAGTAGSGVIQMPGPVQQNIAPEILQHAQELQDIAKTSTGVARRNAALEKLVNASRGSSGSNVIQIGGETPIPAEVMQHIDDLRLAQGLSKRGVASEKLSKASQGTRGTETIIGRGETPLDPAIIENAKRLQQEAIQGEKFVQKMQRPTIAEAQAAQNGPGVLQGLINYVKSNPKKVIGMLSSAGVATPIIYQLVSGGFSPKQQVQGVTQTQQQQQGGFAEGFTPGTASGIAKSLPNPMEQAQRIAGSNQAQGNVPQDILLRMAKAILMQGGGGATIDQIADLIYKSGALGQQDKYREAQIQEMGSREARTNAAIQMSRQVIEDKYNNAMTAARMNPKNEQLAEEARKAREERDAKLAEFDQRVYGAQQAGAQ